MALAAVVIADDELERQRGWELVPRLDVMIVVLVVDCGSCCSGVMDSAQNVFCVSCLCASE